jgi:hypothetical protein
VDAGEAEASELKLCHNKSSGPRGFSYQPRQNLRLAHLKSDNGQLASNPAPDMIYPEKATVR